MSNKPPTARAVWDAYVERFWLPDVTKPLGRRGNTITTENPNAHLARELRYVDYQSGRYVIECCNAQRTTWARVMMKNLGTELGIFARTFAGLEREVSVEFVTRKETEKF